MPRAPHQRSAYGTAAWLHAYRRLADTGGGPIFSAPFHREEAKALERHRERSSRAVFTKLGANAAWFENGASEFAIRLLMASRFGPETSPPTRLPSLPTTADQEHALDRSAMREILCGALFARAGHYAEAADTLNDGLPDYAAAADYVQKVQIERAAKAFADTHDVSSGQAFDVAHQLAVDFSAAMSIHTSIRGRRDLLSLAKAGELLDRFADAVAYLTDDKAVLDAVRNGLAELRSARRPPVRNCRERPSRAQAQQTRRPQKIRHQPRLTRCLEPA